MTFDEVFSKTIEFEGGYSTDHADKGNWTGGEIGSGELKGTKYGISARAYPTLDIKNITIEQAKELYRKDYWNPIKGDQLNGDIGFHIFDFAVNAGVGPASRAAQAIAGAQVDGVIGPKSVAAINAVDEVEFIARLLGSRLSRMTVANTWGAHGKGWARRIATLLMELKHGT